VVAVVALLVALAPVPAAAALRRLVLTSELLSQFWGAPVDMKAAAFVPAGCRRSGATCGVMYHLPGYGGTLARAGTALAEFDRMSAASPSLAMAHVFLDPSFQGGYNYFTDSENDGPWNTALTQEFVPYVETQLGVGGAPERRFLAGVSSGGWAAVWLQVSNPSFFRAVWVAAPDPLDFRHFYQIDVTPGSSDNFYHQPNGAPRFLIRGRHIAVEHFMRFVDAVPSRPGLISSYEFAWSPRGADGLPLRFFDRADGSLRQETLAAWQAYDVHRVLADGGPALRAALAGKLNVYCGTDDDFFYNQPTRALCEFFRENGWDAVCVLVPGATHRSIDLPSGRFPAGLDHVILARAARILRDEAR